MDDKMTINIASPPDRENIVVEFIFDDEQWAELNQENGVLTLEIYPRRNGETWRFNLLEVQNLLEKGRKILVESNQ